ncbi:MAG: arylesterase [Steroidobacteraceae bacterium]|jgi:acyl-CoA thioesterase-1
MSRVIGILVAWLIVLAASAALASQSQVILVYGDSLSAGYGIRVEQGWVNLLQQKILQEGYGFRIVNASVSGETSAGGLSRLAHALSVQQPRIVLLELGANDGLRGLPLTQTRTNLDQIITQLQAHGVAVLLLGVRLPPNYGERYTHEFAAMYDQLAATHKIALLPFLLEGVALRPGLMQEDGLHPNAQAQPLLLENVWPRLAPLLRAASAGA